MIGIKDMEMPSECWSCDLIHDARNGYTVCSVTGGTLYPMGARNTRPENCPLLEVTDINDLRRSV